jgi:hypothetical protein
MTSGRVRGYNNEAGGRERPGGRILMPSVSIVAAVCKLLRSVVVGGLFFRAFSRATVCVVLAYESDCELEMGSLVD